MPGTVITYNEKPHGRIVATIPIWADFYLDISTMESAVVRCKDCKHYEEDFCWRWGGVRDLEHFCSYGERREGE